MGHIRLWEHLDTRTLDAGKKDLWEYWTTAAKRPGKIWIQIQFMNTAILNS